MLEPAMPTVIPVPIEEDVIDWDTLLESGTVPTEPLKVVLNDQQMEQEILSTFRAPGWGFQDYTVIEIDATAFEAGGMLIIDVLVGPAEAHGSFDLFDGSTELPTVGPPDDALTSAWDVPSNEKTLLVLPLNQGQTFKLGATGNWPSEKGSINGFLAKISIGSIEDIAAIVDLDAADMGTDAPIPDLDAADMGTDAEAGGEGENTEENSTEP